MLVSIFVGQTFAIHFSLQNSIDTMPKKKNSSKRPNTAPKPGDHLGRVFLHPVLPPPSPIKLTFTQDDHFDLNPAIYGDILKTPSSLMQYEMEMEKKDSLADYRGLKLSSQSQRALKNGNIDVALTCLSLAREEYQLARCVRQK